MDDSNLDEKSLGKWQNLQYRKSMIPQKVYKEWKNHVGLKFSVGDTTLRFTIKVLLIRIDDTKYHS